jgi:hypothetical protein
VGEGRWKVEGGQMEGGEIIFDGDDSLTTR